MKKFNGLVLFLVLLVTYEFTMMQIEARICFAKSKKFRGRCYFGSRSRNCKTICKIREGFTGGLCKRGVCMCSAKCGTHHLPYNAPPVSPPSEGEGGDASGGDGGQGGNADGGDQGGQGGNAGGGDQGGQGGNVGGGDQGGQGGNAGGDQGGVGFGTRTCQSKSKKFRGRCYFASQSRNCKTICKIKEGFIGGLCKRGICMCTAKCGTHRLPYNAAPGSPPAEVEGGKGAESSNVVLTTVEKL